MSLTFHRGTKLVLIDGSNRFEFLVGSASASQTFIETTQKPKTIQNPNLIDNTFITEKGNASLSFNCYITDGVPEEVLLLWLGFTKSGSNYIINPLANLSTPAEKLDVYIDSGTTIYKLPVCVIQNMSFVLERKNHLLVEIQATAADLTIVASIPTTGTLTKQDSSKFYNAPLVVGSRTKVSSVTCEITREISWVTDKSLQNIGIIYKDTKPIITSFAISGSITAYKTDNTNNQIASTVINIKYGNTFEINLSACNTTDRWALETIHKTVTDYKILPTIGSSSYIKF